MTAAGSIRLRVFSGPNLGAEIILPAGEHLVGSDDSCDIILSEGVMSPRHALLQVISGQDDAQQARVEIRPVDDAVLIDHVPTAAEGSPWGPGSPCLLGSTMLAWLPAEATAEAWQEFLARLSKPADSRPGPSPSVPGSGEPAADAGPDMAPESLATANSVAPAVKPARSGRRFAGKAVRAMVVLLCLGSLAVSYEFSTRPTGLTQQELAGILKENQFTALTVHNGDATLEVRGEVTDDGERARLLRLAQSLQSPVQFDVHVRNDRIEAIVFAFNSQGLFPEISKDGDGYLVRGYMRSGQVEETAFAAALEDFPAGARPLLKRDIVHADAVDATLRPLLAHAGMDYVSADYRPGLVLFSGAFSESQRGVLETVMSQAQQALGVPVPYRIVVAAQAAQTQAPAREGTMQAEPRSAAPAASGEPLPGEPAETGIAGLHVTGVTLSPMRFISVDTGERIFEGGTLPTGHTLEHIDDRELKLRKDGVVTIYRLRGANE
jgi:type III secretion protein D